MNPASIYSDGTYIEHNPSLHQEDSAYKMTYLESLLETIEWPKGLIRILDVGGGAGILGWLVCEWFHQHGYTVECWALDLSEEMLALQRAHNPYITETRLGGMEQLGNQDFDLALVIDVIEHVPEHHLFSEALNRRAKYILYNIPIEQNLFDVLRNLYMRGRYYALQTKSLGHVHFFTPGAAKAFVRVHHQLLGTRFSHFAMHLLTTDHPAYKIQLQHRLRYVELKLSAWIRRWLCSLAPWLVQGSLFILARRK
ncbi:class I SAM-dependent methyltransferase [Sulfurirhabdus autotrophica]|nr:class I SAM-dependent methyltransferase [Sulfurirhabdus autotrophica]